MFGFFFVSFFPELEPLWAWSLKVPTIVKVELCFSPHASLPFFFFLVWLVIVLGLVLWGFGFVFFPPEAEKCQMLASTKHHCV